jgi:prepilin signal peptidase PulO-like enzyme (type II secretory pathway)
VIRSADSAVIVVFFIGSVALSAIDARTLRLPDAVTRAFTALIITSSVGGSLIGWGVQLHGGVTAVWARAGTHLLRQCTAAGLIALAALAASYVLHVFSNGQFGLGDVKIVPAIIWTIVWVGEPVSAVIFAALSAVLLGIAGLILTIVRPQEKRTFAAGPWLFAAAWLTIGAVAA